MVQQGYHDNTEHSYIFTWRQDSQKCPEKKYKTTKNVKTTETWVNVWIYWLLF